jgi:hypothetical protein
LIGVPFLEDSHHWNNFPAIRRLSKMRHESFEYVVRIT